MVRDMLLEPYAQIDRLLAEVGTANEVRSFRCGLIELYETGLVSCLWSWHPLDTCNKIARANVKSMPFLVTRVREV